MLVDDKAAQPKLPTIELGRPESGVTAHAISNFVASGKQGSAFDIGMSMASAIPNSDVSSSSWCGKHDLKRSPSR